MRATVALACGFLAVSSSACRTTDQSQAQSSEPVTDADVFARDKVEALAAEMQLGPEIVDLALKLGPLFKSTFDARNPPGTAVSSRAVFLKTHGCSKATFTVAEGLPDAYRKGLFAEPGAVHEAWVRASSDTVPATSDFEKSTVGFAIKVLGVEGEKVLPNVANATTQDFLLQNHHIFFADTATEFFQLFTGGLPPARKAALRKILDVDMNKDVSAIHEHTFWSTTPYRFGDDGHARYKVVPCDVPAQLESLPASTAANASYLRERWIRDVKAKGGCFELQVQLRREGDPIDAATVDWPESASPPTTVATITLPAEDPVPSEASCEHMSFQPWHALTAHRPVGSLNEVRGLVYKRMADHRRGFKNGQPIEEPSPTQRAKAP